MPLPIFLFSVVVLIDVALRFSRGEVEDTWVLGAAVAFVLYLGGRSIYGVRQAIDFERG